MALSGLIIALGAWALVTAREQNRGDAVALLVIRRGDDGPDRRAHRAFPAMAAPARARGWPASTLITGIRHRVPIPGRPSSFVFSPFYRNPDGSPSGTVRPPSLRSRRRTGPAGPLGRRVRSAELTAGRTRPGPPRRHRPNRPPGRRRRRAPERDELTDGQGVDQLGDDRRARGLQAVPGRSAGLLPAEDADAVGPRPPVARRPAGRPGRRRPTRPAGRPSGASCRRSAGIVPAGRWSLG